MLPGTNGLPDPSRLQSFVGVDATGGAAGHPVDLKIGPGGDLFYVDMDDGTVHRITYAAANQPPTAVITANPTNGPVPLTVSFNGTGSSDPEGKPLSYSWDLNGDGTFGDATASTASYTYTTAGVYHPSLRVTDDQGVSDTKSVTVTAGNTAPIAVIDSPASSLTWKVGDTINFSGHATDAQDGTLPASALSWSLILHHCFTPTDCHTHLIQTVNGVSSGSFTAPDHEYPCWLELQLDRDRLGRTDLDDERPAGPEDGRAHVQEQPGRSRPQRPGGERGAAHDAVLRDRGRRLGELGQRPVATAVQQIHVLLHVVVGRRPAEPHHHCARREYHLHRDLPQALKRTEGCRAAAPETDLVWDPLGAVAPTRTRNSEDRSYEPCDHAVRARSRHGPRWGARPHPRISDRRCFNPNEGERQGVARVLRPPA